MKNVIVIILTALLFSLVLMVPLAVIWALNTLFSLGIAYTFWTWLAVVLLNLTWFYKPTLKKGN